MAITMSHWDDQTTSAKRCPKRDRALLHSLHRRLSRVLDNPELELCKDARNGNYHRALEEIQRIEQRLGNLLGRHSPSQ